MAEAPGRGAVSAPGDASAAGRAGGSVVAERSDAAATTLGLQGRANAPARSAQPATPLPSPTLGAEAPGASAVALDITVLRCIAPRQVQEWRLSLAPGATVADALKACGAWQEGEPFDADTVAVGIWGRTVALHTPLQSKDRLELYRPLQVDPKVARRERFARQGARTTGLFARQRPGAKAGY